MTAQQKWQAVQRCDEAFDGRFFYAVKTTGVFCRPSCKSKTPKRENLLFFDTAQQAMAAGFRPCKRCRSDLAVFRPDHALAQQAKAVLNDYFAHPRQLAAGLAQLGVSRHRLNQLLQAEYGVAPAQYVAALRLGEAKQRLQGTNEPITTIAAAVGFEQTTSFCRFFKAQTGQTPGSYRKGQRA